MHPSPIDHHHSSHPPRPFPPIITPNRSEPGVFPILWRSPRLGSKVTGFITQSCIEVMHVYRCKYLHMYIPTYVLTQFDRFESWMMIIPGHARLHEDQKHGSNEAARYVCIGGVTDPSAGNLGSSTSLSTTHLIIIPPPPPVRPASQLS